MTCSQSPLGCQGQRGPGAAGQLPLGSVSGGLSDFQLPLGGPGERACPRTGCDLVPSLSEADIVFGGPANGDPAS